MKPGDKAWVFDTEAQRIRQCTIFCPSYVNEWAIIFKDDKFGIKSYGWREGIDLFPTREALCEHYRKIFE